MCRPFPDRETFEFEAHRREEPVPRWLLLFTGEGRDSWLASLLRRAWLARFFLVSDAPRPKLEPPTGRAWKVQGVRTTGREREKTTVDVGKVERPRAPRGLARLPLASGRAR